MKRIISTACVTIAVAVMSLALSTEAEAQKRGSVSSTKTNGIKKGGPSTYKAAKLPKVVNRSRATKDKRRNAIRISDPQMTLNAQLHARHSPPSEFLSRAPLGPTPKPKINTSRMSTDVNGRGAPRSKPVTSQPPPPNTPPPPLPSTSAPGRAKKGGTSPKITVISRPVPGQASIKGILLAENRVKKHGRQGLTFNAKDQFKWPTGQVTTARNGRGTGVLDKTVRAWRKWQGRKIG